MLAPLFDRWIVTDRAVAAHEAGLKVHHRFTHHRPTLEAPRLSSAGDRRPPSSTRPGPRRGPCLPLPSGSSFVLDRRSSDDGEIYARMRRASEAGSWGGIGNQQHPR